MNIDISNVAYSVCNHTRDKQIGLPLRGRPILLSIVCTITDRIGLHSVLLPLLSSLLLLLLLLLLLIYLFYFIFIIHYST